MWVYLFLAIIHAAHICEAEEDLSNYTIGIPEDVWKHKLEKELNIRFEREVGKPSYEWKPVKWPTKSLPTDMVLGGMDSSDICEKCYIGRAWYKENLLPARVCGSDGRAFVTYNDTEIMLNDSEVLITRDAIWKPIKESRIPKSAFQVGTSETGEKLYVGRWFVGLRLLPGKVGSETKKLQVTYFEKMYNSNEYEILVLKSGEDF